MQASAALLRTLNGAVSLFHIGNAHLHYLEAVAVSYVAATAVNYVLSARFVFVRGRHPAHKEIILLYLVSAIGLLLNLLFMSFFVGYLSVHAMPAKIASTGMAFSGISALGNCGFLNDKLSGADGYYSTNIINKILP